MIRFHVPPQMLDEYCEAHVPNGRALLYLYDTFFLILIPVLCTSSHTDAISHRHTEHPYTQHAITPKPAPSSPRSRTSPQFHTTMGRSRDRTSAVRKTLPPSPAAVRLSSARVQDQRRMFCPADSAPTTPPSSRTLRELLDKRSAADQNSQCLNVDAPVDARHAPREGAAPASTREPVGNDEERAASHDASTENAKTTANAATDEMTTKWVSASKNTENVDISAAERVGGANRPEPEKDARGNEWLRRFPLRSAVQCETLHYRARKNIKLPDVTCALDVQERFARSVSDVLRSDAALSGALAVANLEGGEAIAKSLMSQEELEMYEYWCNRHDLPDEDWDSLSQGVSQSDEDVMLWTKRARDLNQIYRRSDLTSEHARAWWSKNAAWKPLAVALAMVKDHLRQAELETCMIALAQMRCHRDITKARANRYSKSSVRRYTANVGAVIAQLIQRQTRIEDGDGIELAITES